MRLIDKLLSAALIACCVWGILIVTNLDTGITIGETPVQSEWIRAGFVGIAAIVIILSLYDVLNDSPKREKKRKSRRQKRLTKTSTTQKTKNASSFRQGSGAKRAGRHVEGAGRRVQTRRK